MNKQSTSKKLKRVVIKEELVALTGHYVRAVILNQFIYWSERTKDFDQFIDEERKRDSDIALDFTKGWVYKTAEDLSDELMLGMSVSTIRRYLGKLVKSRLLDERNNPKHKWDRTLQYRPNMVKIQTDLFYLGYALEGYPLVVAISKMKNGVFEIEDQTPQNKRAIPKTTTETTTETISPSAENEPPELIQPEHGQSSGDFGDPTKGDQPINETIPPGEAVPQVSVFDENGYIIPQVETVLETMYKIGVVKMEEYDSHPHLGNIMWYHWVDSGQSVESIPLKLAEEYGYKPETSGPPENVLIDTRTPYEVDEQTQLEKGIVTYAINSEDDLTKVFGPHPQALAQYAADVARSAIETLDKEIMAEEDPETLTDVFGPNPRQQATTTPQPQPNDKPELSEADVAHLQTFGSLPGNETEAFDTIQEIRRSGWEIWDPIVERGIAYCLGAIRSKKPDFAVPNNVSVRKDWNKDVKGHLQDYQADDLKTLYGLAVDKLEKAGMSYTRPGSLTKTLPDVVDEPTATTVIDKDGGFYV